MYVNGSMYMYKYVYIWKEKDYKEIHQNVFIMVTIISGSRNHRHIYFHLIYFFIFFKFYTMVIFLL